MTSVIVHTALSKYGAAMIAVTFRLMALLALIIMPFGMTMAPALAQTVDYAHSADHAMPAGHCGEQQDKKAPAPAKMDCTVACTALPASAPQLREPSLKPKAPRTALMVTPFTGIVLEIATPPPRV